MGRRRGWLVAGVGVLAAGVGRWRPFRAFVEGDSMRPALEPGQFVVAVRARRIHRGDVVVVRLPGRPEIVKRVVGLPGERVEVRRGRVQVANRLLREPYASGRGPDAAWDLGPDAFAVLGDDRDRSTDSRAFGPVPRSAIAGVVRFRYWPRPGVVT